MRVHKEQIRNRDAYEFLSGFDGSVNPNWSSDISRRFPVFTLKGGCNRMDVVYNAPLGRYLMTMRSRAKAGGENHFGIYDAPAPWGPWTTVHWQTCSSTGSGYPGDMQHFPSKWISADGKTMHMACSSGDAFTVQKVTLTAAGGTPSSVITAPASSAVFSPGQEVTATGTGQNST